MDDKNVVKKRVTLAIAFAVFIVVVIAVILLIKPVMSRESHSKGVSGNGTGSGRIS